MAINRPGKRADMKSMNRAGEGGRVFGVGAAGSAGMFALLADQQHRVFAVVLMVAIVAFGAVAVILGAKGMRRSPRGDALTGLVLGLFALAFLPSVLLLGPRANRIEQEPEKALCANDVPGSPAWHLDGCRD
jgi:hypothetical protein